MDRNALWNMFKKSGSIEAYLLYKENRNTNYNDGETDKINEAKS
ncbi:MAG: YqzL family protein [Lachnospiraceae bacterium]|jgi:hypothetical protein|nr:YqzL family protein [Lachnospiraceae bacterium]